MWLFLQITVIAFISSTIGAIGATLWEIFVFSKEPSHCDTKNPEWNRRASMVYGPIPLIGVVVGVVEALLGTRSDMADRLSGLKFFTTFGLLPLIVAFLLGTLIYTRTRPS
jgi:hypothetical protein